MGFATVVTAAATIFFVKVIEKPGENLGQLLWDKRQNLIGMIKSKSDKIAGFLEGSQHQSLNIAEVLIELKAVKDKDPEIAQAMKEAEVEANKESNPQFQQQLQEVREAADKLRGKEPIIQNSTKLTEGTDNINQAKTIYQTNYQAKKIIIHQSEHG